MPTSIGKSSPHSDEEPSCATQATFAWGHKTYTRMQADRALSRTQHAHGRKTHAQRLPTLQCQAQGFLSDLQTHAGIAIGYGRIRAWKRNIFNDSWPARPINIRGRQRTEIAVETNASTLSAPNSVKSCIDGSKVRPQGNNMMRFQ